MPIKVRKKDGRLEDFDRNKITDGIIKSGATQEQVENIARQVETWIQDAATNGVVDSNSIKGKVLELLRPANREAADKFEAYKKNV